MLHPLDTIKCRLQIKSSRRSLVDKALYDGLYDGLAPALISGAPAASVFFAVKDAVKQQVKPAGLGKIPETVIAVAGANVPYWLLRNPTEVIKARRQAGQLTERTGEAVASLWEEKGLGGFYRGYASNYAYAFPVDATKFVIYGSVKEYVKEPSTLKKDLSKASSSRWKTAPILVSSVSLTSFTSRSAGIAAFGLGPSPPLLAAALAAAAAAAAPPPRAASAFFLALRLLAEELLAPRLARVRRSRPRGAQPRDAQLERGRRPDHLHKLAEVEQLAVDGDDLVAHLQLGGDGPLGVHLDDRVHLVDAEAEPARAALARDLTSISSMRRGAPPASPSIRFARARRGEGGCVETRE